MPIQAGLKTIVESTKRFTEAACPLEISGIFYAVQHASYQLLSFDEYQKFGRVYDFELLNIVANKWLNMLHIHVENIMFNLFSDYPVQVINWHDRETFPNLKGADALCSTTSPFAHKSTQAARALFVTIVPPSR